MGPNWEEILGGEFAKRSQGQELRRGQKDIYGQFENTFMMYLPRLCEHCLNPACVARCPSGSIYKREEDGIVLIDQDKCRGWRMCVSGCPYKKIYYNWKTGKAEKCIFCYPRIEAGQPTVCSETCVGRIRYLGVLLYDADRIEQAASVEHDRDLYQAQLDIFPRPERPAVIAQARADGIPRRGWRRRRSPVYKMAVDWKVALPLHPEYRTLPMVWYAAAVAHHRRRQRRPGGINGEIPDVNQLRIPVKYLANLLTAGDTVPVVRALERMLAMRAHQRSKHVDGATHRGAAAGRPERAAEVEDMYQLMAIANYEDRFVIPSTHREYAENAFNVRGNGCGFSFGKRCSRRQQRHQPVRQWRAAHHPDPGGSLTMDFLTPPVDGPTLRVLAKLLALTRHVTAPASPRLCARRCAAERAPTWVRIAELRALIRPSARAPALDVETAYVRLFDRGRSTSAAPVRARARRLAASTDPALIDLGGPTPRQA